MRSSVGVATSTSHLSVLSKQESHEECLSSDDDSARFGLSVLGADMRPNIRVFREGTLTNSYQHKWAEFKRIRILATMLPLVFLCTPLLFGQAFCAFPKLSKLLYSFDLILMVANHLL